MKDGSNRGAGRTDGNEVGGGGDPMRTVVFDFEDTGDSLSLLPLAARRALDVAGFRLSLEGWQSLGLGDRKELAREGARDSVDASSVEESVRRSAIPATRIRPVPDPDPLLPPEQLSSFLGPRRSVDPAQWARLRALDRYALVHVLRRSIAHDDPMRLEAALVTILPGAGERASIHPTVPPPTTPSTAPSGTERNPSARPGRRLSPAPSAPPRSPKRSQGDADVARGGASGGRRATTPTTERRSTSASPRRTPPARAGARNGNGGSLGLPSDPPARAPQTSRRDRDTLDSVGASEARISGRQLEPSRTSDAETRNTAQRRAIQELDDVHDYGGDETDLDDSDPVGRDRYSTHLSDEGEARMVDVGDKPITLRRATAQGTVHMRRATARRVVESDIPKGDVLSVARIAGIMAAKRAPEIIPLCHHVALTKIEVHLDVDAELGLITALAIVEARDRTGVEMEALAAAMAACLTVYDMLKGIDRDMVISDIKLLEKSGGRSGGYVRSEG